MRGGQSLSEQNQSFLRFALEESIWFPKGFEVSELYSLSIEPDVDIIEKDQYVVIAGSLDISGEYRVAVTEQESGYFEVEQTHHQLVQDVFVREEDSMNVFTHSFPVDISIPANRVEDRNAIEVEISTFDYTMPESNCIKLMSELLISGIYDGVVAEKRSADTNEQSVAIETVVPSYPNFHFEEKTQEESANHEEQAYESFTVEAYALPREESAEPVEESVQSLTSEAPSLSMSLQEQPFSIPMPVFKAPEMKYKGTSEFTRKNIESQSSYHQSSPYSEQEEESSKAEVPIVNYETKDEERKETMPLSVYESSGKKSDQPSVNRVEEDSIQTTVNRAEESDQPSVNRVEKESIQPSVNQIEEESIRISVNRSEEESVQTSVVRSEEDESVALPKATATVSLTDFFGKKDTQTHTRLKVCIVQNGDTLSDIAGRYEVSRLDILSHNELDSENDVQEGQVLYIPERVIRK